MNYKGFDEDFRCRGMQYEVGKKFTVGGEIEICENGLHSCKNPLDVLRYYEKPSHRYAIVSPSGSIDGPYCEDSKIASESLEILKEISRAQLFKESLKKAKAGDYIVTDGINVGSAERIVPGLSPIGVALRITDGEIIVISTYKFNICNWYTAIKLCENFNMLGLKWRLPSKEDIQNSDMKKAANFLGNIWLWLSKEYDTDDAWLWGYNSGSPYFGGYGKSHSGSSYYAVPFCNIKLND